jgi:Flp pilus assembly protein TadG
MNFKKYTENADGNVAVMFGLLVTLLGVVIAVGTDYSNGVRLKNSLQAQVDAAVLAA